MSETPDDLTRGYSVWTYPDFLRFNLRELLYGFAVLGAGTALGSAWETVASGVVAAVAVLIFWRFVLTAKRPRRCAATTLVWLCVAAVVWCCGLPVQLNRSLRHSACFHNLRRIDLALAQYHTAYGSYPPAFLADESGRRTHSWRALLLPYLGENWLAAQYRWDEPWHSVHNRKLAETRISVFECPLHPVGCCYQAVIGESTMWPGTAARSQSDVAEQSQTILLVERYSDRSWAAPEDPTLEEFLRDEKDASRTTRHLKHVDPFFEAEPWRPLLIVDGELHYAPPRAPSELWCRALSASNTSPQLDGFLDCYVSGPVRLRWEVIVPLVALLCLAIAPVAKLPLRRRGLDRPLKVG